MAKVKPGQDHMWVSKQVEDRGRVVLSVGL